MNSVIIFLFLSQMTLLRLIKFHTLMLVRDSPRPALLDFFLSSEYLFYNDFSFIRKFWSCSCLSFHWISNKLETGYPVSSHSIWLFLCWLVWSCWLVLFDLIGMVFVIMGEMFHGRISLNLVLLLPLVHFVSGQGQVSLISMVLSCLCCCHSS